MLPTTRHRHGDVREDGYIFAWYRPHGGELWLHPDKYHRRRIATAAARARRRAKAKGVPFDIDIDYLVSLYPEDGKCPALGIDLVWGDGARDNSPSVDRIVPSKGYVRGNVCWLSVKANTIKTNATPDEISAVARFIQEQNCSCNLSERTVLSN